MPETSPVMPIQPWGSNEPESKGKQVKIAAWDPFSWLGCGKHVYAVEGQSQIDTRVHTSRYISFSSQRDIRSTALTPFYEPYGWHIPYTRCPTAYGAFKVSCCRSVHHSIHRGLSPAQGVSRHVGTSGCPSFPTTAHASGVSENGIITMGDHE